MEVKVKEVKDKKRKTKKKHVSTTLVSLLRDVMVKL